MTRLLPRSLIQNQAGTAAVELAIIVLPLLTFFLAVFELGYDFYVQNVLDYALYTSVREIATGSIQSTATSLATFEAVAFCPAVGAVLPCSSILVNVTPVASFSTANMATPTTKGSFDPSKYTYCPGQPGQLMLAQAVYPAPTFIGWLVSGGLGSYRGATVRLITSTAGFVNEPYTATSTPPSGC